MSHRISTVPSVAIVDWILALGNAGAASNARGVCDRREADQARVDALLSRLDVEPTRKQPAA